MLHHIKKLLGIINMPAPLTFVLGATGTGKTDLSIALARKFNGEIINSDAMQLYRGLDIVTNKATVEERTMCVHHLIDILQPSNMSYTIHDYIKQAKAVIDDIKKRGKTPIVVGGTNYYVDSLLWDSLISHPSHGKHEDRFRPSSPMLSSITKLYLREELQEPYSLPDSAGIAHYLKDLDLEYLRLHIDEANGERLHSLVMQIDSTTAKAFHPNQIRKSIRALEVFKQHGRRQSDFISELNSSSGEQVFGSQLLYPDCLILWIETDQETLDQRLDSRVGKMISNGLIDELYSFHEKYNSRLHDHHADYTRGIFQCIGFKEMHEYVMMNKEQRQTQKGLKVFNDCISRLQSATRRYARYQNKWVRKQLFEKRNAEMTPTVYKLDSTDAAGFQDNVVQPAVSLIEDIVAGRPPSLTPFTLPPVTKEDNPVVFQTCEACNTTCIRQTEWTSHLTSRRHKKRLASINRENQQLQRHRTELSGILDKRVDQLGSDLTNADNDSGQCENALTLDES